MREEAEGVGRQVYGTPDCRWRRADLIDGDLGWGQVGREEFGQREGGSQACDAGTEEEDGEGKRGRWGWS